MRGSIRDLKTVGVLILGLSLAHCSHQTKTVDGTESAHSNSSTQAPSNTSITTQTTLPQKSSARSDASTEVISSVQARSRGQMRADLKALALDSSWELLSNEDGIIVHKREVPGSPLVEFRGETIIHAPIAKVAQILVDTPRKLEWIDRIHTAKDIKIFSPLERIEYNRTKAPWPVKDRDFVFHAKANIDVKQKAIIVQMRSVDTPEMPVQDCCVRGEIHTSYYVLKSVGGGTQTHVTVQINADPKGAVPSWLVNLIQKSWPKKTLEAMRAQAGRADVSENPYYKAALERAWAANGTAIKASATVSGQ